MIGEDYKSVKILAKACTKLLLQQEPNGPYFLAGYSFGSLVAIEIATILQESGRTVAMLTMIDTIVWIPEAAYNSKALAGVSRRTLADSIKVSLNYLSFSFGVLCLLLTISD